jgi:uncharacterized protein
MLIGMALLKIHVLTGARSRRFYHGQVALGFGVGSLLVSLGLRHSILTQWDVLDFVLVGQQLHYWGDILIAVGMIGVVMLLCQRGWPLRPVAAVGRMALSNYLLQTLICTTLFYGHGLGLFGRIDRAGQLGMVVGIWTIELIVSSVWLSYFSAGPVERLMRGVLFGADGQAPRNSKAKVPSASTETIAAPR